MWGQESWGEAASSAPLLTTALLPATEFKRHASTSHLVTSSFFAGRYYYLAIGGAVSTYVRVYLERLMQDERLDARLLDVTERLCMLSLQGPFRFPLSLFDMMIHIFCDLKLIWFVLNTLDFTFITSNNRILICMRSIIVENYWER